MFRELFKEERSMQDVSNPEVDELLEHYNKIDQIMEEIEARKEELKAEAQ